MSARTLPRRKALAAAGGGIAALALPSLFRTADADDDLLLHEVKVFEEMGDTTYRGIWNNLRCLSDGEFDWRPHPESNSLGWVVGHLTWFEEWVSDAIDETGLYLEATGGPTAFQEPTIERQKARYDSARARLKERMRSLDPEELRRQVLYVYNEERDARDEISIHELLKTHVRHQAGHRYQIRYIRGTYSRAHGTEKACFDAW